MDCQNVKKSKSADRVAVFQDTQNWCETDPDLIAYIQKAKKATEGAFLNNPEVVSRAYKTALTEFPKVFDRVVFAVLCNPEQISKNYSVFSREFSE